MLQFALLLIPVLIVAWLGENFRAWGPSVLMFLLLMGGAALAIVAGLLCFGAILNLVWWLHDKIDPAGKDKRARHRAAAVELQKARQADALELRQKQAAEHERIAATAYRSSSMTGHQFEHWTADRLKALGWRAEATKGSGDQGADVLAQRDGKRVVIQCKLYSKPVGNKAVQEVFAAMHHYGAHAAVVVTNTDFTPSARKLATSTGVHLIHADALSSLNWRIKA